MKLHFKAIVSCPQVPTIVLLTVRISILGPCYLAPSTCSYLLTSRSDMLVRLFGRVTVLWSKTIRAFMVLLRLVSSLKMIPFLLSSVGAITSASVHHFYSSTKAATSALYLLWIISSLSTMSARMPYTWLLHFGASMCTLLTGPAPSSSARIIVECDQSRCQAHLQADSLPAPFVAPTFRATTQYAAYDDKSFGEDYTG